MDFRNLNLDNIEIEDSVSTSKEITIEGGNYFYTPIMHVPFGIENYKTTYSMNLQFRNIKQNQELKDFLEFVQKFETNLKAKLNIEEDDFISQLKYHNKYDPMLNTKFLFKFDKIECDVKNKNEYLNIYDLGKNFRCKCLLYIDKVWYFKGRYSCKLKVKEIYVE